MRVALYARVSTEEQAVHGLSIDAQLAALREWSQDKTVVGEYVDRGVSARIPIKKRPELQRLLRDVEQGKVDTIAFVKLDRWTRNVREYYKAQDVLDAHGVAWRALHEDYETETAAGRLKVNIMLAVAQDEADRTSERVKAVFAEKRRKGLAVNGNTPPGIDFNAGNLTPNADAGKVRELFDHYIANRSLHATAISTKDILGRSYSQRGIKQLLQNEKYLDTGIITPATWEQAQTILAQRGTRTVRSDRAYLFTGLIVCPECGCKLTVRTRIWHDKEYIYYRCDRSAKGYRCAWRGSVKEDELERELLARIIPAVEGHNIEIKKRTRKPPDVNSIQKKLDRLTDLYLDEKIDKDDFDRRAAPLRDALREARLTPHKADTAQIVSALDVYPTLSKAAQKAFWSALIKSVTPTDGGFSFELFY